MRVRRMSRGYGVVLAGVAALVLSACGVSPTEKAPPNAERADNVQLALQPVAGLTLTSLHYVVTRGASLIAEGNLPTPGTGRTVNFGVPLPVGVGYTLALSAESAEAGDDITCTGSFGPFEVKPNEATNVSLALVCVDNTSGQIFSGVDVETTACPRLIVEYAVAEPYWAAVGSSLSVRASARDLDDPSAPVTYAWSVVNAAYAGVGQFAPSNAASTSFNCSAPGDQVRIRVTASNAECSKSLETVVSCATYESCGNGVLDTQWGESCDTALDPTCPSDCTRICGDGNVESGEQCDPLPLNPAFCFPPGDPNECQLRNPFPTCGDGIVTPPEACDVGSPLPIAATCVNCQITHPTCGDGFIDQLEECDSGPSNVSPVATTSRTCSSTCETISTQACVDCEQAGDCFASSDNCLGPSGSFTLPQQRVCTDVMQCIQDSNCLDGTGSLGRCYCGTLSTAACGAAPFDLAAPGAPNGPCAAIMQQGNPGVTTNSGILGGLTTKSRPAGAAGQRLNCQKVDPVCAPICGVQ